MPQNLREHRTPVWRKTVALILLPAIIFLWMTGWTLTQIGPQGESIEIRQKTVYYPITGPKQMKKAE